MIPHHFVEERLILVLEDWEQFDTHACDPYAFVCDKTRLRVVRITVYDGFFQLYGCRHNAIDKRGRKREPCTTESLPDYPLDKFVTCKRQTLDRLFFKPSDVPDMPAEITTEVEKRLRELTGSFEDTINHIYAGHDPRWFEPPLQLVEPIVDAEVNEFLQPALFAPGDLLDDHPTTPSLAG
jgi:hypothetical protein